MPPPTSPVNMSLWMSLGFDFCSISLYITITIDAGCKKNWQTKLIKTGTTPWLIVLVSMENWSMKHASRWRTILANNPLGFSGHRADPISLASWSCLKVWNHKQSMCSHHGSFIFPIKIYNHYQSLTFGGVFVHMGLSENVGLIFPMK